MSTSPEREPNPVQEMSDSHLSCKNETTKAPDTTTFTADESKETEKGLQKGLESDVHIGAIQQPSCSLEKSLSNKENQKITEAQNSGSSDLEVLRRTKLQTISQYKTLVENKRNHEMMLKEDTITGFLVLCLGDDVPEVVENSFEVFLALSKHVENLFVLKNINYMMDALRCVTSNSQVKDGVRKDARKLIAEMKSLAIKDQLPLTELSESMKNVMVAATSFNNCPADMPGRRDIKQSADLNTTMSTMKRKNKGRETILFLENDIIQKKSERTRITQALIGVRGIISVTYDLKNNLCVIRGKRNIASEEFGRVVAALGLANVYLVRKNENKEELKILIPADSNGKENALFPPYPEEQENEEIDDSAAVARKDQVPAEDASFFKSAKNFIKRSFYW